MRILMVSYRVPWPLNEGGTIAIYNNLKGYAEAGHEVTLLALNANKHRINLEDATGAIRKYARFESVPVNTDVNAVAAFVNLFKQESYNVERFYSPEFEERITAILTEDTFDLIQVEGTYAARYTGVVMQHKGNAKVILRQHNVEYQIWERRAQGTTNTLKKWYLRFLADRLKKFETAQLNRYDAVIPITEDDAERFVEMGCTVPVHVAPAGLDLEQWEMHQGDPRALYHLGSLEWTPNKDAVLWFIHKIWPLIHDANDRIRLFIGGKGLPASLYGLKNERIRMFDPVPDAKAFIQDKGICLVPLLSGSGLRIKIIEAMAAGKPVVSTTIGAQGIKAIDGEHLLIRDEPDAFAKAVLMLANDEELYRRIRTNGRRFAEDHYSNESVIKRLITFTSTLK